MKDRITSITSTDIKVFGVFKCLTGEELNRISLTSIITYLEKGSIVFNEGCRIKGLYVIIDGFVKTYKIGFRGKEQIFQFLKKGDVLGYESVLNFHNSNHAISVMNDVKLIFIPLETLSYILENNFAFRLSILQLGCKELKVAQEFITDITQKKIEGRVVDLLLHLKDNYKVTENSLLDISLNRKDFANKIGACKESVIRILSDLRRNKMIETKGNRIGVLDTEKLKQNYH
jgi:CRP-like cAMP-binding protein